MRNKAISLISQAITRPCSEPAAAAVSSSFSISPVRFSTRPALAPPTRRQPPPQGHRLHHPAVSTATTDATVRAIHTTLTLRKQKGGKQGSKSNVAKATERVAAAGPGGEDPADFEALQLAIDRATARLRDDLSKLRQGGRIGTEAVEGLRVELKGGSGGIRVGDLAQVLPRSGRSMVILVGEEEHVKPVTSALMASQYSLNPVPNAHNPLELELPIPAPTADSREQAKKDATKAGEKALLAVRDARGVHQKLLRALETSKKARPEDTRKARDKMEKIAQDANAEVKRVVDGAKKSLDG